MRKHMGMIVVAVLVVLALLANTVAYTVDEFKDLVLIKRFGKVVHVYRGHDEAGLRLKWPWPIEKVVRYDARTFLFESPYVQVQTKEKWDILISMFCAWRIDDAAKFHKTIVSVDEAEKSIRARLRGKCGDVLGGYEMKNLVNADPAMMRLKDVEHDVLTKLRAEVEDAYGVQISMVGIKTWGLSQRVSSAAIDQQIAERQKYEQDYRSRGESRATAIRERARGASETILAFADRKASEIRSEGDRAAAEIYKEFDKDPELSAFLRSLESLKTELKSRSVMLLDGTELPAIRWFRGGVNLSDVKAMPGAQMPAPRTGGDKQ
jgi:modulator of FtsH protease HflC